MEAQKYSSRPIILMGLPRKITKKYAQNMCKYTKICAALVHRPAIFQKVTVRSPSGRQTTGFFLRPGGGGVPAMPRHPGFLGPEWVGTQPKIKKKPGFNVAAKKLFIALVLLLLLLLLYLQFFLDVGYNDSVILVYTQRPEEGEVIALGENIIIDDNC